MPHQRCTNSDCRRPFQVNEYDGMKSGSNSAEVITCPHCGDRTTLFTDSVFVVHALSEDEEMLFNAQNPA